MSMNNTLLRAAGSLVGIAALTLALGCSDQASRTRKHMIKACMSNDVSEENCKCAIDKTLEKHPIEEMMAIDDKRKAPPPEIFEDVANAALACVRKNGL
ncbi:hypothetical protein [Curvibacter lanceolatus]|uniref:hypothetical protein n=1 Tax=Curvibacter lanceolatus TaxID=86182 RepID=UPI000377F2F5|nr:hypothetical protein [Curvibacter lanceolatus]